MKQKYVKPSIIVERFALTQSIASGCGTSATNTLGKPMQWSKSTCAWDVGGIIMFLNTMADICEDERVDSENMEVNGYCYNNPDGSMIFSSF